MLKSSRLPLRYWADSSRVIRRMGAGRKRCLLAFAALGVIALVGFVWQSREAEKSSNSARKHFTIIIHSRSGGAIEDLMVRPAGNNQWMRALRVRNGTRILEEHADSAWPLNSQGQVDW